MDSCRHFDPLHYERTVFRTRTEARTAFMLGRLSYTLRLLEVEHPSHDRAFDGRPSGCAVDQGHPGDQAVSTA